MRHGIYMASKTKHAGNWRLLRRAGVPIISTWIDEVDAGETSDFADLWRRCILESTTAERIIAYAEEGDVLKGVLVEVGAAIACGVPVIVVGPVQGSWVSHPSVSKADSVNEALAMKLPRIPADDIANRVERLVKTSGEAAEVFQRYAQGKCECDPEVGAGPCEACSAYAMAKRLFACIASIRSHEQRTLAAL